jgi:uncharacterized repeat protein (TIGR03847 family)
MAMSKVDRFASGALGEPGNRLFLLEVEEGVTTTAYALEKLQVEALAEEAKQLLRERGLIGTGLSIDPGDVHESTHIAFRVGGMQLVLGDDADFAELILFSTEEDPPARYELSLPQLDAFAREAVVVVAAGRPECPRCGLPMDPDGHNCPRSNGDLRGHRP